MMDDDDNPTPEDVKPGRSYQGPLDRAYAGLARRDGIFCEEPPRRVVSAEEDPAPVSDERGAGQLREIVSKIERLEDEWKEAHDEARAAGFNIRALRLLVGERREAADAAALKMFVDGYRQELGMEQKKTAPAAGRSGKLED